MSPTQEDNLMGAKDHQRPEYTSERLSLPFPLRLPLATSIAALSGLTLGLAHGSQERGLRFRAENAHRLPNSQVGWYLYHKSKNYHVALGGIQEGCKMALKQGFWVGAFFGMEEAVDRARFAARRRWVRLRGRGDVGDVVASRDFCSSVLAGLGTAGGFSAWNRFPVPTAARVAKLGLKYGLAFGLVQDAVSLLRGRRLGYVEFVKRLFTGNRPGNVRISVVGNDNSAVVSTRN